MDFEADASTSFKFQPANTNYHAPAPAIRASTSDAHPPHATSTTSMKQPLSGPADQSTSTRAIFPGLNKSMEKPTPFTLAGRRDNQDITAQVKDSGRKSLQHVVDGGIIKDVIRIESVQQKENYAVSVGIVSESLAEGPTTALNLIPHGSFGISARQTNGTASNTSASLHRGLLAMMPALAQEQGHAPVHKQAGLAPGQVDEEFSQSLPLPLESQVAESYQTQGYVEDSYQTQGHGDDSYHRQGHVDDSHQTPGQIEDSYQAQDQTDDSYLAQEDRNLIENDSSQIAEMVGVEGVGDNEDKEATIARDQEEGRSLTAQEMMSPSATRNVDMAREEGELGRLNDAGVAEQLDIMPMLQTAMHQSTAAQSQLALPARQPCQDVSDHANGTKEGNPAGSQRQAGNPRQLRQEAHDDTSQRQTTAPTKALPRHDSQPVDNATGPVTVAVKEPYDVAPRTTSNAIQCSLSSHSGSVRVLPSRKRLVHLQSASNLDSGNQGVLSTVISRPSDQSHLDVGSEMAVNSQEPSTHVSQIAIQPAAKQAGRKLEPVAKAPGKSGVKTLPEPGMFKKKTHGSVKQQMMVGGVKEQIAGNARYQKQISQIIGGPAMTAKEVREARDAAKPPQHVDPTEEAVFRPIVTPTKKQRDEALDALLSRASISSPASRSNKGHPRAGQVQERQAERIATRSTSRPHPSVGTSHDGAIDEKTAIDLMFKAREREAEISRLRSQVKALLSQSAVLEKEKIQLVTRNEETLSKNEQVLRKHKEAVARARDIVNQSQTIRDTCQRDLAQIRENWVRSLQRLGMCKPELDEAKEALISGVAAMHQVKSENEHLGLTAIDLQGQLDEETSGRSANHEALLQAMANVQALTEQCQGLREEFAAAQRIAIEEHHTSLAALERDRESLRESLKCQVHSLTAENKNLSDKNHTLQTAVVKAETLAATLSDHLEEAKESAHELEESHRAEEKARRLAYQSLETEYEKLKQEYEKAHAVVSSHAKTMKTLQEQVDCHGADFALQLQAHDAALLHQKNAAYFKEKELTDELLGLKADYAAMRSALTKSEGDVQQKDGEKQEITEKHKQLKCRLKEMQSDYEASREAAAKTASELAVDLKHEGRRSMNLERTLEQLGKELSDVAEEKEELEVALATAEKTCESHLNRSKEIEAKYASLQDEVEELRKRAQDGQAAHLEDVTKERAKYEEIQAIQESFKKRYQTGEDLVSQFRRIGHWHYILTASDNRQSSNETKGELAVAQTEASRWRKTAGRASTTVYQQSQKLGGRNLIGSDFEDPSSSPHEPLRSALSRTEHAPLIDFGDVAAQLSRAPSTPLTDVGSSPQEQISKPPPTQTLTSFLAGTVSTTKRVSFQELAGDASDEMDNDVPDSLGKIAGEEDEMEEDIEESESLMEAANTFTSRAASSIGNFTQSGNKHVSIQREESVRSEVTPAVAVPARSTQNKTTGNAALGMIRTTRSQSQTTTYSGASRKRVASIVVGNDMESFTSTQEDAIYGKRGATKKQRR
ncbi:hypothetical protein QFC22_000724 [Naganishia vaughanmartiniae]|uniref:Uncharacterized protein n=1 Tax=Naganishia vaughanmartiniae TaxID=1424756 RepID=A0ACC2XJX0_9TREE|nr:hypothetical protein QFC22_000724 [Naganishia vaughanmartiniae]